MDNAYQLDVSKVPREVQLILAISKMGAEELERHPELFSTIDWDLFLQYVHHHRIYPSLFAKLKQISEELIPVRVVQAISHAYQKNTLKMLYLCAEMEQVSKLLEKSDIKALFLKGPVLAIDLYGDVSLRTSGDLDVLIPFEDLEKVDTLLEQQGYKKDEYIQTVLNDWKWRHHHYTYFHPTKKVKLEIHWRLNPAPSNEPAFRELWDRKRKFLSARSVYLLGKEDLFYFLTTHGARHGWSRLRWLMDIHQLAGKDLNWNKIHKLLKRTQSTHIGGQALLLTAQLLTTNITKDMKNLFCIRSHQLAQQAVFYIEEMVNLHTDPVPSRIAKYHSRHLFSLMSFQQRVLYILSILHPFYEDLETLPLPKKLHFLYFPLRPFLLLWRRSKQPSM